MRAKCSTSSDLQRGDLTSNTCQTGFDVIVLVLLLQVQYLLLKHKKHVKGTEMISNITLHLAYSGKKYSLN